ncbi:Holliday junction ATP-dependent DNA helicase [Candidatus Photodesmus katoptron]|uniref:Holliday junction branch migration protein RuvA n=1 Tax=Candidatus Photodesmus anomalopis TaxID=28176 RepID=UPI0004D7B043|nr:Holliday junction branch migration protein RuvA [Candidatus Photodesmus katoptron]KEY90833.1 Holliday junction ATP-dependent DNA helicase [Candidatus Photodesmus katoptron]
MIGRLHGILLEKRPPELLMDVNGVGYEMQMPISCFDNLPNVGRKVIIYTHFIIRGDAQLLYGFNTLKERALFREVIKTNGIGPKLGLNILYKMSASQFISCVAREDISALLELPGVGKKTAKRLILEMKDRLKDGNFEGPINSILNESALNKKLALPQVHAHAQEEAISALLALGYKPMKASKIVSQIAKPDMTSECLVYAALKSMS